MHGSYLSPEVRLTKLDYLATPAAQYDTMTAS
jgi:hypothetical protein